MADIMPTDSSDTYESRIEDLQRFIGNLEGENKRLKERVAELEKRTDYIKSAL